MQIINYSGQGILARFCISDEETKRCLELSLNVLKVQANIAFLIVNGKSYEYNTTGDIPFGENDTVYINTNGYCRLFFCYGEYSQTVIVTNKCNSNCIMCPYTSAFRKNTYDTDDVFLLKSIEYLPSNTRHLVIKQFIEKYGIDTEGYDIIKGWRANASYFYIAKEFVRDNIDLDILSELLSLGGLGIQYCLKSEEAFLRLKELSDELITVDYGEFNEKYNQRDVSARRKMRELVDSDANKVTKVFSTLF